VELPIALLNVARRKLDQLAAATNLAQLAVPTTNHLEALKRDRMGQYAIRINRKYRICFTWTANGPIDVEITDYL
jgi:proteic killer suppression protein